MAKLAAILIRGTVGVGTSVQTTLEKLRLSRKHSCVIVDDNETMRGMLKECKDFVTWGPISEDAIDDLDEARDGPVYNLHPPRGGFGGIKEPYSRGGALGKRDDMDELVRRML
jgi:large subunit ribosomal protein L30